MNLIYAAQIIDFLRKQGVVDFCLCAGARNSPLIAVLDENKSLIEKKGKLFHFFDERSAGFFALGRSQKSQKPVAIITTSGTAATELISSSVEAYYTQTPLIYVTADRPPQFRKSGAPQSIEQVGIFSHYTHPTIDLHENNNNFNENPLNSLSWNKKIPLHLNICFSEPLLKGSIPKLEESFSNLIPNKKSIQQKNPLLNSKNLDFYHQSKNPLYVISGLNEEERYYVLMTLKDFSGSWWVESLSGLRGHEHLEDGRIQCGDAILHHFLEKRHFDGVVRIGAIPTLRTWRDLEEKFCEIPVVNFSSAPWTGLARKSEHLPIEALSDFCLRYKDQNHRRMDLHQWDQELYKCFLQQLEAFPRSELSLVRKLSFLVKNNPLYLGNSLPIREWDLAAKQFLLSSVSGNRGANGIDGQISSFFGGLNLDTHSWALLGDLTTLYDLNAPWILPQLQNQNWTLAIMNNSGGQIFKPMFQRESFLNRHTINFENWSRMWNLSYSKVEDLSSIMLSPPSILELTPSEEQSNQLQIEITKLWKTL